MRILRDRRGILTGRYLTGPFVILFVVFIMGLFVALSAALSFFNGPRFPPSFGYGFSGSDFFLEEISVLGQDGRQRVISVEDLAIEFVQGKRSRREIDDVLRSFVSEERPCIVLYKASDSSLLTGEKGFRLKDGKIEAMRGNLRDYFPDVERLPLRRLVVEYEGVHEEIYYYGGRCS